MTSAITALVGNGPMSKPVDRIAPAPRPTDLQRTGRGLVRSSSYCVHPLGTNELISRMNEICSSTKRSPSSSPDGSPCLMFSLMRRAAVSISVASSIDNLACCCHDGRLVLSLRCCAKLNARRLMRGNGISVATCRCQSSGGSFLRAALTAKSPFG